MARVIQVALVANDQMSRAFASASTASRRLADQMDRANEASTKFADSAANAARIGAKMAAMPSMAPVAAGIAAMVPAMAAAGAGALALQAVAKPAFERIKTAIEAQAAAQANAGAVAAQAQAKAAAQASAQRALSQAIANAADAHKQALDQVRDSETRLADAQKSAKQAQEDLNEARKDARRSAEDMANDVASAQLSVRSSTWDVYDAQREYNKVMADPRYTKAEKERAKLALEMAKQRLKEQQLMLKRLKEDEKEMAKAGVEGSDQVKNARDRLAEANKNVTESEKALSEARKNVAKVDKESAQAVAEARKALAEANKQSIGGNDALAKAMADLSPAAKTLMQDWQGLTGAFDRWQRSMEPKVLPLFSKGIAILKGQLPSLTPIVNGAAKAVDGILDKIAAGAKSEGWAQWKKQFTSLVPASMTALAATLGNVLKGIGGIMQAFMPQAPAMLDLLTSISAKFADWGTGLGANPGFTALMAFIEKNGPTISAVFQQIADAALHLGTSLAPLAGEIGMAYVTTFGLLAQAISSLSPETIQLLAKAFIAYRIAMTAATIATTAFGAASAAGAFIGGFANVASGAADGASAARKYGAALRMNASAAWMIVKANTAAAASAIRAKVATIASTVAQKAAAVATRAWAIATGFLNAVMAGNPLALIVLAIMALVAAIVIAYNKSETFRKIVQAAWEGIKTAAAAAWNFLKTVFSGLWNWITTSLVPAFTSIWNVVKAAFEGIWSAISAAWGFIKPIFAGIFNFIKKVLVVHFTIMWNVVKAVWIGIQIAFKVAWAIIKVIFEAIAWFVKKVIGPAFSWFYDKVIKPVWNKVKEYIRNNWNTIKIVFNAIKSFLAKTLGPAFTVLKDKAVGAWNLLKTGLSKVWNDWIKPMFKSLKDAVAGIRDGFDEAVKGIRTIWNRLKDIAKRPINFVIGMYNDGIVGLVNKIASFAGIKTRLTKIPELATGGVLPGYAPGRDTLMAAVSPGESVFRPEFTRAVGKGWVNQANSVARFGGVSGVRKWISGQYGGEGLAFAKGGTVPGFAGSFGLGGVIDGFIDGLKDFSFGDVGKMAEKVLNKVLSAVPGAGIFRDVINAVPLKLKDSILKWIKDKIGFGGTPGMNQGLKWAKTQAGKPYQWGGVGNPSWDCSGFMSGIVNVIRGKSPFSRLFSTFSFGPGGGPGFDRNKRSGFMVGVSNAGKGHMAGTLLGHNVESASSRGVNVGPRARGYNDPMFPWQYGFKADTGALNLMPGWNPPVFNGTGKPELLTTPHPGGGGDVHFHNHGVIGSQAELDRWMSTSMERLRRKNKLPG